MPPCGAHTAYHNIQRHMYRRSDRLGSAMLAEQVSDESPGAAPLLIDLVCRLRHATRLARQLFEKCGDYER